VLGTVPGILGCLQANELIKLIIGVDTAMLGQLLLVGLRDTAMKSISLSQDPTCMTCTNQRLFEKLPRACIACVRRAYTTCYSVAITGIHQEG